jgi:hypothetical protein
MPVARRAEKAVERRRGAPVAAFAPCNEGYSFHRYGFVKSVFQLATNGLLAIAIII